MLTFNLVCLTLEEGILKPTLHGASWNGISRTIGETCSSDVAVTRSNPTVPGRPRMASDVTKRFVEIGMPRKYKYPLALLTLKETPSCPGKKLQWLLGEWAWQICQVPKREIH